MCLLRAALAAVLLCAASPALAQASDLFAVYADNVNGPCRNWAAITPSDTTDPTYVPKAIYVGGARDVVMVGVEAPSGSAGVTWKGIPAASPLPVRPRRILTTGTTATLIVACY